MLQSKTLLVAVCVLGIGTACSAFLGVFPVNAKTKTYSYNVNFVTNNEVATVTGYIVTTCDNKCAIYPTRIVSWSFMLDGSNAMSSDDGIGTVTYGGNSPLTATRTGIVFDPTTSPSASYLEFGYADLPNFTGEPSLVFQATPFPAILYSINISPGLMTGVGSSALQSPIQIATLEHGKSASAMVAVTDPSTAVPEPSTWAMMLLGFAGLAFIGYRTKAGGATLAQ